MDKGRTKEQRKYMCDPPKTGACIMLFSAENHVRRAQVSHIADKYTADKYTRFPVSRVLVGNVRNLGPSHVVFCY